MSIVRTRLGILSCLFALTAGCNNPLPPSQAMAGSPVTTLPAGGTGGLAVVAGTAAASASGAAGPSGAAATGASGASAAGGGATVAAAGSGGAGGASGAAGKAGASGAADGGHAGSVSTSSSSGGCEGENLLPLPEDPLVRGPWDVGVRTVTLGRLTVELFYPAEPGSTEGKPEATYNLKTWLPAEERSKVPDDHSPDVGPIGGHLFRDVPLDGVHGPYPVVIFMHGTSSMRIANASANAHWASRGFVVVAADYPGLTFDDQLKLGCGLAHQEQDTDADMKTQLDALNAATGELAFLAGHIDMKRLGLSGHSQGACMSAINAKLPNVQVVVPLTGSSAASEAPNLKSIMWIAGMADVVIGYDGLALGNLVCLPNPGPAISNVEGFNQSPGQPNVKKRLVGLKGGGHLSVTDLCQTNAQGKNAIQEAVDDMVCGVNGAAIIGLPALNDCGSLDWQRGVIAVNYASTIALEETLHCKDRSKQFENMQTAIPEIGDYRQAK